MAQQCLVRDLMLSQGAQPIPLNFPLRLAAERLLKSESDVLPVVDEHGRLAGVLAESSVVKLLLTYPASDLTIQNIVSRHAESVYEDSHLSSITHLFRADCHSAIPVVNKDGFVTGIIVRRHVLNVLLDANPSRSFPGGLPIQVVGMVEPTPVAPVDVSEVSPADSKPADSAPSHKTGESTKGPTRPHFLRAEEARRRLTLFDDQSNK